MSEAEKDESIKREIRDSEMVRRAILRLALDAGDRFRETGTFTNDRSMRETRIKWDSLRSNSKRFLYIHFDITVNVDDTVEKESYWQAYNEYCASNDYEAKSNAAITRELQYVPGIGTSDDSFYTGLQWKDQPDEPIQTALTSTQHDRVTNVKALIEEFQITVGGADKEIILKYVATNRAEIGAVSHTIDKLLEAGELTDTR